MSFLGNGGDVRSGQKDEPVWPELYETIMPKNIEKRVRIG